MSTIAVFNFDKDIRGYGVREVTRNLSITSIRPESKSVLRGILSAAFALFLLCLLPQMAAAQTVNYYTPTNTAAQAITDNGCTAGNSVVRDFTVSGSYRVGDVNLGVLIGHTYRSDLRITLKSPQNTTVTVLTWAGNVQSGDNYNDLLDDEAATAITGHNATVTDPLTPVPNPPGVNYSHSFRPSNLLSAFDGQQANGTWTMTICDAVAGDTGTLQRADLVITSTPPFADLSLSKTVGSTGGSSATYNLTVTNSLNSDLSTSGITVRDILPSGVTFVSASGTGTYNNGTGIWTVGTLAPGQSASISLNVTVTATSGTVITNIAEITASSAFDVDSTVNNGVTTEDDYSSATFTAGGRLPGIAPVMTCPVGSTLFDWDGRSWAAGSLTNNYLLNNVGTFNIAVSTTGVLVSPSPTLNANLTGGIIPAEQSLFMNMNNTAQAQSTKVDITLPTAVNGLQFKMFDVDFGAASYADKMIVTGKFNGANVTPILTNGVSNYVVGNVAIGDAGAADTSADGNVTVTFTSPVDTVTVEYGNHTTAPADPTNQWASVHDITFCNAQATLSVTKISSIITDGISTTNPKFIPGATVQYCITVTNAGSGTTTAVSATDTLPTNVTFVAGSMRSGATCGAATTVEDDDNAGADETDPFGMSIAGTTMTGTAASLPPNGSLAMTLLTTVN